MYLSSENKSADQLRSYCEADLRLCFRLCRLLVFLWGSSNALRTDVTTITMSNEKKDMTSKIPI